MPLPILLANDPTADYSDEQPAVVLFQNFIIGDNSPSDLDDWVITNFGAEFTYVHDAKSTVPSAVISRFTIAEYGVWSDLESKYGDGRSLYARIDLPGERDLWVINAHLSPESELRLRQTETLLERIITQLPKEDFLLFGGQLNITDNADPALGLLQEILIVEDPLVIKQDDGDVYDWLLADTELTKFQFHQAKLSKTRARLSSLDIEGIRQEVYRLLQSFRLNLAIYLQPPPPIILENGVTVEDSVSGLLLRNRDEYRFTPALPGLRGIRVEMESTGPGDADLQLAYWDPASNSWIFYANQATPGTSNESVTITQSNLLNREWRIIVEHGGGVAAPYRLRAFAIYDLQALHSILNPSPLPGVTPPGPVTNIPWQNVQPAGWQFYALDIPANTAELQIELERTSSGEAHLYVQKDTLPGLNSYAFRSQGSNIIHTLTMDDTTTPPLSSGTWYIGVYAPGPQDADFDLTVTLSCCAGTPPFSGDIPLNNSIAEPGSVWFGDWQYYTLDVPMNATWLEFNLTGTGPGDADLYYGGSQPPTLGTTARSRQRGSSQEQLAFPFGSPAATPPGPWPYSVYIGVHGYSAATYELSATWSDNATTQTLPSGEQVFSMQNIYVYDTQPLVFAIQVPLGTNYNDLRITAVTPDDVVLYVRKDVAPDKLTFDFTAGPGGNGPEVLVTGATSPALTAGTWWFAMYSNERRSDIIEMRAEFHP
ncbi:MAG: hypothetical protein HC808_18035 [Candidatus Competibacteraceae bacterium]|nr:hypothetical protein [Candidatus Competibacteraceae bacterium]